MNDGKKNRGIRTAVARSMDKLMLTCRDASELTSLAMDGDLGPVKRLQLRMHILVCRFCRRNRRQLNMIRCLIADYRIPMSSKEDLPGPGLSEQARDRIEKAVRNHE